MNTELKHKLYNITFTLHDLTDKPIPNLYYEIKNGKDLVKKGNTNAQGEITLKYVGGNTLTLFVRKDIDNTLKEIGKVHTPSKNIKVKLISPKMKFDVTLLPHQKQGKYWRGTYKVKSGDTLSKIAKEHHTTVSALLALNPNIKSPHEIYQNENIDIVEGNADAIIKLDENMTVKVPPHKKTGTVSIDRKSKSTSITPQTDTTNKTAEPKVGQTKPQPSVTKKEQSAASDSKSIPQQKTSTATTQKIEVQQEHNEDKKPVAVASLSGCVCKDYDLIWGKTTKFVNCEFRKKVIQICKDMWPNDTKNMANYLMACMHLETGGSFDPAQPNGLGYYGLIQFGPDVRKDLNNISVEKLTKMSGAQQLDLVKQHFTRSDRHKLMKSLTDMYLYINYPNALLSGKNKPNDILYEGGSERSAYHANPAFMKEKGEYQNIFAYRKDKNGNFKLDKNKKKIPIRGVEDGKTYIWEVTQEINKHLTTGLDSKNKENNFACSIKPVQPIQDICPNCQTKHVDLSASVEWISQFTQPRPNVACARTCVLILKNSKLSSSAGSPTGLFQVALENSNHSTIEATSNFQNGLNYLDKELNVGHPVMIGVDHKLGYGVNEGTTDHFIVVVGRGCENGKVYYRFYDVGTRHKEKGTSNSNKLYIINGFLRGKTAYNGSTYTMTQVRRN